MRAASCITDEDYPVANRAVTCSSWSSTINQSYTATGAANHLSDGYHRGTASFRLFVYIR